MLGVLAVIATPLYSVVGTIPAKLEMKKLLWMT
jgi:hypothetical protein